MGADNTYGETFFNPDKCTCTPTDLQPFGECICGAEESSRTFEEKGKEIFKREMTALIAWLQREPSIKQFYMTPPETLLQYYLEQRGAKSFAKKPNK